MRPDSAAIHVSGRRASAGEDSHTPGSTCIVSTLMSGCRNRLNITRASAPAASRRVAILPRAEKNGESLTATGTLTASLTAWTISTWRSSTSSADCSRSPGTM